jgi:hypothetical protein
MAYKQSHLNITEEDKTQPESWRGNARKETCSNHVEQRTMFKHRF